MKGKKALSNIQQKYQVNEQRHGELDFLDS